eukprot:7948493-Prorocentrum_lima.AAC.1
MEPRLGGTTRPRRRPCSHVWSRHRHIWNGPLEPWPGQCVWNEGNLQTTPRVLHWREDAWQVW